MVRRKKKGSFLSQCKILSDTEGFYVQTNHPPKSPALLHIYGTSLFIFSCYLFFQILSTVKTTEVFYLYGKLTSWLNCTNYGIIISKHFDGKEAYHS